MRDYAYNSTGGKIPAEAVQEIEALPREVSGIIVLPCGWTVLILPYKGAQ